MAYDIRQIEITISKRVAKNTKHEVVVCDNTDYKVNFTFDSEWDNYPTKTALFIYGDNYSEKTVMPVTISESTADAEGNRQFSCLMPRMSNVDSCLVGVYATRGVGGLSDYAVYSPSTVYNYGDIVRRELSGANTIYQCTANSVTGTWNVNYWVDITSEVSTEQLHTTTSAYITCISSILSEQDIDLISQPVDKFNTAYLNTYGHLIIEYWDDDVKHIIDCGMVAPQVVDAKIRELDDTTTAVRGYEGELLIEFNYDMNAEITYQVTSTNNLNVNINKDTWKAFVSSAGVYSFNYVDGTWKLNGTALPTTTTLDVYGITYSGTLAENDLIIVRYVIN